MKRRRIESPHGSALITAESPQLTRIEAESARAAYFAQGYVAGRERLWQLELTRRIASGTLAAIVGAQALRSDRFQRQLGLVSLAERDLLADSGTTQAGDIEAYVGGINRALAETIVLPAELLLLRHRPRPFRARDVYLVGQLKHFINSTWKFEIVHTLATGALSPSRARQLFATITSTGDAIDALPIGPDGRLASQAADVLADGLAGLDRLGLSSPDIGSNAFAIAGRHTRSGCPLLASDPHMGLVNPGFNLLFRLETADGLDVIGSHFPGAPGIVIGRNRKIAWGMVGLMADNQDLALGSLSKDGRQVLAAGAWTDLESETSTIRVAGAVPEAHTRRGFSGGRLISCRDGEGLFLRWAALDSPAGTLTLADLNRASDWTSFRAGLCQLNNAPMIAVYADVAGNIGLQAVGLIPRRETPLGSLVQSLERPSAWRGYFSFDSLPSQLNPPGGIIVYSNQYSRELFDAGPHISNRWHPPTRSRRIETLIAASSAHDLRSVAAIQDDLVDGFAAANLEWLLESLGSDPFGGWRGDTRETEKALLFEAWIDCISDAVLAEIPAALSSAYRDQWPMYRWNIVAILRSHAADWQLDVPGLLRAAFARAAKAPRTATLEYRHALRRSPLGRWLFSATDRYVGGSRETVHVARRSADHLTASQSAPGRSGRAAANFSFGPSFKIAFDLSAAGEVHYLANMDTSGRPLRPLANRRARRRWRRGQRFRAAGPTLKALTRRRDRPDPHMALADIRSACLDK